MLTGKQKRYLRKEAHHLDPIFQIGKGGISENMIEQLNEALEKRELIKVHILQNNMDDHKEVANSISEQTESELVQLIGSIIILYKESKENKKIELP
ncbi:MULTISPECIES: ribosome assembly RNA-binding protein YhbY [Mammaliicoccus]|jgi:RNA-binding protein|uniref:Ribosome assembly RNA-binding protein YhbY n=2 Tax=Mammaliicoccus lentus TaxID=42858 RepID=A0AAP1WMM5_MAMLE|nr:MULTISPECIES: ribosome assembly RNA-binding protein YhbY [Mammaliicoccus]HBV03779.1 ribosome assembly RNA-binding protein YhbY [Staphylococcus sp.]MBF0747968.1 ribosome assembly RNA-binding protein YhbY [Mammaliicoccus lentus]MBF0793484.1 ribosome assembly RNA-binding protein YhbY [Mammaliicoccus lentus]MBF0842413.1 ribosome assembly RNA-binding protein YhbY [Mammaliicoccus lentus]MBU6113195.1 ribosome assembly RNA-binding protein YhbY [Mammaliicoccus lentus]